MITFQNTSSKLVIGKWTLLVLWCLGFGFFSTPAYAEHRVALLIGNSEYQDKTLATPTRKLKLLAASLEKYGVRCTIRENLDEANLKSEIDRFADNTPTRGTALVYFAGQVLPGSYKGKPTICVLGTNSKIGRGYSLDLILKSLSGKGGSSQNLIVLDSPQVPNKKIELPEE